MPKPAADSSSLDLLQLASGDVAVLSVDKVTEVQISSEPDAGQLEAIARQRAEQNYQALLAALRAEATISRQLRNTVVNEEF
jgi:peptidyl-prolyl cis-trans isomerase D